jgi:nicotinamidase-related amidase
MKALPRNAALLVVDLQRGFDDPAWGPRSNPRMEANVARLLDAWRAASAPVIHVRHDSPHADGRMRPGTIGNSPKPEGAALASEWIYHKSVNSAFIGTTLEGDLRKRGIRALVIAGLTTNHCISTTARMAGNLGFETVVVSDATAAFARRGVDGVLRDAGDVHAAALSDLQDEFAEVADTAKTLSALARAQAKAHA